MTDPAARRPWRRRARWCALAAGLLALAYVASTGPVTYLAHRGWLPTRLYSPYCRPAMAALNSRAGVALGYWDYIVWWQDLGVRHREASSG